MQTMSREGNRLVYRWDGETLVVELSLIHL